MSSPAIPWLPTDMIPLAAHIVHKREKEGKADGLITPKPNAGCTRELRVRVGVGVSVGVRWFLVGFYEEVPDHYADANRDV